MKLLLDTQLLLWAAGHPDRLSVEAREAIENVQNELMFSSASLWEVAIKSMLGRPDFRVDARVLRRGLLENGYGELAIAGDHAVAVLNLPPLHRDPFDRVLLAQARVRELYYLQPMLLVAQYPGPIRRA